MLLAHALTILASAVAAPAPAPAPAPAGDLPIAHSVPVVCSPHAGRDLGCKHDQLKGMHSHKVQQQLTQTALRACHPEPSKNRGCFRGSNISETKSVGHTIVAENDAR